MPLTPKQEKILEKARDFVLRGDRHPTLIDFREKLKRDFAYYYGHEKSTWSYAGETGRGQWLDRHLTILEKRNQTPITVNMIKRKINALVSSEVSSRRRIGYRSHIRTPENNQLAKSLTHLAYFVQESHDFTNKSSRVFRDMNVCGIGWLNVFDEDGIVSFENVSLWDMIPDMDDLTPSLTEMRFLARKHWLNVEESQKKWKNFKEIFDGSSLTNEGGRSPQYDDFSSTVSDIDSPVSSDGRTALVLEVQYKEDKKCYRGLTKSGYPFTTFDPDEAEKILDKSQAIEEKLSKQTMRTLFCGSVLLEHEPLRPRIPDLEGFTYIPAVYDRVFDTGVFDGLTSLMIPSQTDINIRRARAIHLLNSSQKIITGLTNLEGTEKLMDLVKGTDWMFFSDKEVNVSSVGNTDLGNSQMKLYETAKSELEEQTGIHPEMMGDTTGSNQSGVAIARLQNASFRSQNFAFDSYTLFKKRVGRMMLDILQNKKDLVVLFSGNNEEYTNPVILNSFEENIDGTEYVANDIRGLPVGIYAEESGDFESSFEETKTMIMELLQNPNAGMLIENEHLLELLGFREAKEIVSAAISYKQRQAQAEQMAKGNPPYARTT